MTADSTTSVHIYIVCRYLGVDVNVVLPKPVRCLIPHPEALIALTAVVRFEVFMILRTRDYYRGVAY